MEDNNCCLPSVKGVGLPRRIAGVEGFIYILHSVVPELKKEDRIKILVF